MPCTTASSSGTSDTSDMSALPLLKRPAHIDEFLLYRLHTLTRIATQGVGLMFRRDIGVSRREWRVLAFVGRFPDLNLTRLADLAGLDTVIASRSVTQLVRRGLLVNTRAPANKRVSVLRLTEAGEAVHARAHAAARRYNMEIAACMTDDEARLLETLMNKLEARASELTEREMTRGSDQ